MQIKRDPITRLWCRSDGAVLLPPCRNIHRFTYTWTFGYKQPSGYRTIKFRSKTYLVHQIICRAFHGLAPEDKPFVDHIDRCKTNNKPSNLHWVNCKENADNKDSVDKSIEKYGIRQCEDRQAYKRAYDATKRAEMKSKGLSFRKGPNGKMGWFPRIHKSEAA